PARAHRLIERGIENLLGTVTPLLIVARAPDHRPGGIDRAAGRQHRDGGAEPTMERSALRQERRVGENPTLLRGPGERRSPSPEVKRVFIKRLAPFAPIGRPAGGKRRERKRYPSDGGGRSRK